MREVKLRRDRKSIVDACRRLRNFSLRRQKRSVDTAAQVRKAIEQELQKKRAMIEDMQKGIENIKKKMTKQKEAARKQSSRSDNAAH